MSGQTGQLYQFIASHTKSMQGFFSPAQAYTHSILNLNKNVLKPVRTHEMLSVTSVSHISR